MWCGGWTAVTAPLSCEACQGSSHTSEVVSGAQQQVTRSWQVCIQRVVVVVVAAVVGGGGRAHLQLR
jgi:hypothetical protein